MCPDRLHRFGSSAGHALRLGALLGIITGCGAQSDPPHIVLLILDTLRADRLGCYGFELETSPELDRLCEGALVFDRVVAPSSWTRPSVAALLTSLPPRSLGIYRERGEVLDERFDTLPEVLQRAGYTTLGATANPNLNSTFHMDQGFDHYADSHVLWPWMESQGVSSQNERLVTAPQLFELARDWIGKYEDGPLYLQLDLMEMHEYMRPGDRSMIRDEYRQLFPTRPDRAYLQSLRQLSSDVAGFVQELSSLPGWEDAVFVVTSDHGEGLHDHPDVAFAETHGWVLYESQLMVPLIVYRAQWPREQDLAGQRVERAVRLLDVAPTLLDLAGLPVPRAMEGSSLLPLAEGGDPGLPEYFVAETEFRGQHKIAVYGSEWNYFENRRPHPRTRLNPRELQRAGTRENGKHTDQIGDRGEVAARHQEHLRGWERRVPRTPPTVRTLPAEERARLRALGYLADEGS